MVLFCFVQINIFFCTIPRLCVLLTSGSWCRCNIYVSLFILNQTPSNHPTWLSTSYSPLFRLHCSLSYTVLYFIQVQWWCFAFEIYVREVIWAKTGFHLDFHNKSDTCQMQVTVGTSPVAGLDCADTDSITLIYGRFILISIKH